MLLLPTYPCQTAIGGADTDGRQWTVCNLVWNIYRFYLENLWLPATRSVYLHLKRLEGNRLVRCLGEGKDTVGDDPTKFDNYFQSLIYFF
ncbi:hypothetical protein BYT27DRAFT_6498612 [Phlegmacium glaucopus]|nr:hypothetical protein BYT27DRAFT_6498612 [Phlegmacium glaucopus]